MKQIVSRTAISENAPFELTALKNHVRVDHDDDDSALSNMGNAAAAEIEHFAQVALLDQTIRVTIISPKTSIGVALPVGPYKAGSPITATIDGQPFTAFSVVDGLRPYLCCQQPITGASLVIEYQAGFGDEASDVPADLAQALMDQAAMHYDGRGPQDGKALTTSPHMARIAARYRGVSL